MIARHPAPVPDACDVCTYALENGLSHESEHGITALATRILVSDLEDVGGGPSRLSRIAVGRFPPVDVGPQHIIEPRHWFWAIFYEPKIQLVLRRTGA